MLYTAKQIYSENTYDGERHQRGTPSTTVVCSCCISLLSVCVCMPAYHCDGTLKCISLNSRYPKGCWKLFFCPMVLMMFNLINCKVGCKYSVNEALEWHSSSLALKRRGCSLKRNCIWDDGCNSEAPVAALYTNVYDGDSSLYPASTTYFCSVMLCCSADPRGSIQHQSSHVCHM